MAQLHPSGLFTYRTHTRTPKNTDEYYDCTLVRDINFDEQTEATEIRFLVTFHNDNACRAGTKLACINTLGTGMAGWLTKDDDDSLVLDVPWLPVTTEK